METTQPVIDILIPQHKTLALIQSCLHGILIHTPVGEARIVVVDNNSCDESLDWLRRVAATGVITLLEKTEDVLGSEMDSATSLDWALLRMDCDWTVVMHSDAIVRRDGWLDFLRGMVFGYDVAGLGLWPPHTSVNHTPFSFPHPFCSIWRGSLVRQALANGIGWAADGEGALMNEEVIRLGGKVNAFSVSQPLLAHLDSCPYSALLDPSEVGIAAYVFHVWCATRSLVGPPERPPAERLKVYRDKTKQVTDNPAIAEFWQGRGL